MYSTHWPIEVQKYEQYMDNKTRKIKSLQFFKEYIKRNIINKTAVANLPSNKK